VRVAVPVVAPGADQTHPPLDGGQERRIGGPRPVVGHREQLGPELLRAPREQVGLRVALDVAGGQHPPAVVVEPQDVGTLVQLTPREPVGPTGRGMEDLHPQIPDLDLLAPRWCPYRHTHRCGQREGLRRLG